MASCQTTQWSNQNTPYARLTVTETSSTATTSTLSWTLQYIAPNSDAHTSVAKAYSVVIAGSTVASGSYDINGKVGTYTVTSGTKVINKTTYAQTISFSLSFTFNLTWAGVYGGTYSASGSTTVGTKSSYSISYNANGGSGAPSSQTKWYGDTIKLSTTKPTRTGYSFQGWSTANDSSVEYAPGANYSSNASVTLYAVWKANTWEVVYDANGGTGAPPKQTKTYGVNLTLSNSKPTRKYYNFLGWSTSATAKVATYAAGGRYTKNEGVRLYAVWELAYTKPEINNLSVTRCDIKGNPTPDGTFAKVIFEWKCDLEMTSILIEWATSDSNNYSGSMTVTTADTLSGTVDALAGRGTLLPDSPYKFRITVTDTESSIAYASIPGSVFGVDILVANKGVSFGKKASIPHTADFAWPIYAEKGFLYPELDRGLNLNTMVTPGIYYGYEATTYAYANCPVTTNDTFVLEVFPAGYDYIIQRITTCSISEQEVYERYRRAGQWGEWLLKSTSFLSARVSASTSVAAGEYIPFVLSGAVGPGFSISDGMVIVGEGVKRVRVSARIGGSSSANRVWAKIMCNNSMINGYFGDAIAYGSFVTACADAIFNVETGYRIGVTVAEAFNAVNGGVGCYMIVENIT